MLLRPIKENPLNLEGAFRKNFGAPTFLKEAFLRDVTRSRKRPRGKEGRDKRAKREERLTRVARGCNTIGLQRRRR